MASTLQQQLLQGWTLSERNICVTGGAKGIGFATVQAVLAHGASAVIFCSRSPCQELVISLKTQYPSSKIHHVSCDVSTEEGRMKLVEETKLFVPALHGLISNVGTNFRKSIREQTADEYHTMMRTNVDSAYFLAKMFLPLLEAGSSIAHVSSAAGVQSSGTGVAYAISKAALNQMARALACEWASKNIRVNAVTPWSE